MYSDFSYLADVLFLNEVAFATNNLRPVISHLVITNGSKSIVNTIHTECYGTAKRYLALNARKKQVKKKHVHACIFFSKALKKCGVGSSSVCMEQSFVLPFV